MAIVDTGIQSIAALAGGSGVYPAYMAVGIGSSTVVSGNTALLSESERNLLTSIDLSIAKEVTYTADFNSVELSGLTISEFGLFNAAAGGSMYLREVIGSVLFDGDAELQIQATLRFARSGT